MKNNFFLFFVCLACFSVGVIHSCTKDVSTPAPTNTPPDSVITTSFTEEFEAVYNLAEKGWIIRDTVGEDTSGAIAVAPWSQGYDGQLKGDDTWYGFTAYSYAKDPDEFIYSYAIGYFGGAGSNASMNSWLITPVLSVKSGDKISFYTRGDTTGTFTDRMQVLMNKSTSTDVGNSLHSVGSFTTVLFDINPTQAPGGYPVTWTKYEYTFSGISGKMDTRIAFRHYDVNPSSARGVGIDSFQFQVN
jgi:hypothetical protein